MPNWVLECVNCKLQFIHSAIDDVGLLNFTLPLKPKFPPGGSELKCPKCGHVAIYQRANLLYGASPK